MTNEQQQLKARFFGMHIGCILQKKSGETVKLRGIYLSRSEDGKGIAFFDYLGSDLEMFKKHGCFGGECLLDNCQIILRPLSSITDQEAIECARLACEENDYEVQGYLPHPVYRSATGIVVIRLLDPKGEGQPIRVSIMSSVKIECVWDDGDVYPAELCAYDYLRSRNFCLPFRNVDPVQAGWAILETENQNPI